MKFSDLTLALSVSLLVVACGGDSTKPTEGTEIAEEILKETGVEPANDAAPCEILDDSLIRSHFEIAEGTEITREVSKHSPHPLCTVSWPKANAAELEEQSGQAMMEYIQKKAKGEDVEMPSFKTTNEVSLTLLDAFDGAEQAQAAFESAMNRLSEGVTASHGGVEVTFQADVEPVDGVGDAAMWAAKLRQVSVVSGRRVFHVVVNTGEDTDRAAAEVVAGDVIGRL